jgi:LmbE family N-acetylglucosaminyl deacetylase
VLEFLPRRRGAKGIRILCIGAHSDDIEIGCAASILSWLGQGDPVHVSWVVLSGSGDRGIEARRSAESLLRAAKSSKIILRDFPDGYLGAEYVAVKNFFESLKSLPPPDLILTHRLDDRHQDHRLASELTWNTFRHHTILEYEIPKYEGDLGHPNVYVPVTKAFMQRKAAHLARHFGSQGRKDWFANETFLGLGRLRGLECRAPSGYAEAFHGRKIVLGGLG